MKTLAFATYRNAPLLIAEDQPLVPRLSKLGVRGVPIDWENAMPPEIDAVVLRSCWNSHLKPEKFIRWIGELNLPLWNSPPVIRWNQDKTHLLDLQNRGVPLPRTQILPPGTVMDRTRLIADSDFGESVIKPTISASAYCTFKLPARDQTVISATLSLIPESTPLLLQEFVPSVLTEGELSFIFFNGKLSHALRKRPRPGDFRVQEDFGGSREPFVPPQIWSEEAREILRIAEGENWLYARVDVVPVRGRLLLMELEAIDPMFYFNYADGARERFAQAIVDRI